MKNRWGVWLRLTAMTVIAVLLIKTLLITSCFIPSSGMENTLYQGEGVLVSKWSYGLRVPFPSVFGYHRIGEQPVKRGDIVLFNNPNPSDKDRRIENRELFISRCIGTAGDTLMLNRELIDTAGKVFSPDSKSLYCYPASCEDSVRMMLDSLRISGNALVGYTPEGAYIRSFSHYEYYLLTQLAGERIPFSLYQDGIKEKAYPYVVPQKGRAVEVHPWNRALLCNTIRNHEHKRAEIRRDTLFVEGKPVKMYVFSKNYYWMASNNPVNRCDSRLFGFVPEDHIIGKALYVWFTSQKGRFFQRIE